jgi:hypothetical protein
VAEAGYFLATPNDLLTARLSKLLHNPKVSGHQEDARSYLLPISPLALLLQDPGVLKTNIEITEQSGRASAKLELRLSSGKPHKLTRRYSDRPQASEGQLDREVDWAFGEAAVWPNFRSPEWRWNFLRLNYPTDGLGVRARFGVSGAAIARMLSDIGDPEHCDSTLRAWVDANRCLAEAQAPFLERIATSSWLDRVRNASNTGVVEEYQRSPYPIEAIFFGRSLDNGVDMVPAGCALLQAKTIHHSSTEGVVAIDFGTTNTIACFENQDPIVFEDRVLHPIETKDRTREARGKQQIRWPFVEFLPPAARSMPTPSVALSRKSDDPKLLAAIRPARLGPIFRSVVYFDPGEGSAEQVATIDRKSFGDILPRARFNLKWSEEVEDKAFAKEYVGQIVMMCAAEAMDQGLSVNGLEWRFSKPDAMSPDQVEVIHENLREAVRDITGDGSARIPKPFSEGLAAAHYILQGGKSGEFNRGKLNIIVDIGGGTTDVALWDSVEPLWSGSYRLAGGQFFTAYLMQNPEFFRRFGLDNWADIVAPKDGGAGFEQGRLTSLGELLFSSPKLGDQLNKEWNMMSGSPEAKGLQRTALTFLAGIAWHVGLVARVLIAEGKLNPESLDNVAFALCGRGSGLFSRLHLGSGATGSAASADTRISRLLTIFHRAASPGGDQGAPPPRPSVFVSATPKTEVVRGMVKMTPDQAVSHQHSIEPAGLTIPIGTGVLAAEDDIHKAGPLGKIGYSELKEFDAFLDALADSAGLRLDLRKDDKQGGFARIQTAVYNAAQDHRVGLQEPPFVTALRALVADLARNARERDAFVVAADVTPRRA